jgi:two-component system sensor histidine kinase PilS (NtrC family)
MTETATALPGPADSLVRAPVIAEDIGKRVARHLLLRTLVITAVLGLSVWLLANSQNPAWLAIWLQSSVIAATYFSSIVFSVQLRRGVAPAFVARQMHVNDIVLTSALIFITGGALSPYMFLYALTIVSAGALSYRRGAVIATVASLVAAVSVALIAHTHVLVLPLGQIRPHEQSWLDLFRTLGINLAALTGVGALAVIFGDQLQKSADTLASTRRAAADLLTLHQDIVRSLSSGLITITPDGTILSANAVAAEILGKGALAGMQVDQAMPGVSVLIADNRQRADLALPTPQHAMVMLGVTVSPLRDVHDEVIGRVINFQDLTELRRLELHARRAERLATVGQLAAGIAHEIRNPLASISGSIELLGSSAQTSEDDRTLMQIVNREVQRLNILIGDLLDYANPRPSEPVEFDLGNLVEETLRVARTEAAFADIELTGEITSALAINADPAKLRQVVWNLVRNARDAASLGGKHVYVAVTKRAAEAVISVRDDGPGIAKELVARIFDPFVTTKQKGTGLGLATSHAVVAELNGRIDVETEGGNGTTMIVTLPINASWRP